MITKDDITRIQNLKAKDYSQTKVAQELNISRSTVARYWGGRKLSLNDLYLVSPCSACGTVYPKPKFLANWKCPYCKKDFYWPNPWFTPDSVGSK
jgi:transcriptional regulator with XRE-family HTH domain